jgi:serine/threonine-protein kinase
MTQVARAVRRAHEAGIVHRDLKPDNIFLVHNDEEEVAKVLDFGIAKATTLSLSGGAGSGTRTGAMLGTPYYMSPEQAEGVRTLDHRTDIWAFGVIAFECLTGVRPFDGETLGALLLSICTRPMPVPSQRGVVPDGFDAWFARACARDPGQRFSSVKEAAGALKMVCEGTASAPEISGPRLVPAPGPASGSVNAASMVSSSGGFSTTGPKSSSGAGLVLALLAVVLVLGGAALAAFLLLRAEPGDAAAVASAEVALTSAGTPTPVEAPAAPAATEMVAPIVSATPEPSAPAAASEEPAKAAAPAPRPAPRAAPKAAPKAAPRPAPAPSPAPAPAPAKPKINLGI